MASPIQLRHYANNGLFFDRYNCIFNLQADKRTLKRSSFSIESASNTDTESTSSNTESCAACSENVGSESGDTEGVDESDSHEEGTLFYSTIYCLPSILKLGTEMS